MTPGCWVRRERVSCLKHCAILSETRDRSEAGEEAVAWLYPVSHHEVSPAAPYLGLCMPSPMQPSPTVPTQRQPRACWRADVNPEWVHSRADRADRAGRRAGASLLWFWQQLWVCSAQFLLDRSVVTFSPFSTGKFQVEGACPRLLPQQGQGLGEGTTDFRSFSLTPASIIHYLLCRERNHDLKLFIVIQCR